MVKVQIRVHALGSTCCWMSLPQCLEKYVCQVKHGERSKCLQELQEPLLQEKLVEKIEDTKVKGTLPPKKEQ